MARVKICPACQRENPATAPFCACGASLAAVPKREAQPAKPALAPPASRAESVPCPEPSCGHPNPPGSDRCLLCFGPLPHQPAITAPRWALVWPWGSEPLSGSLVIGRDPDRSPLAERLGGYPAISRSHARVWVAEDGQVWVEDLGSMNGTFVDSARLAPHQPQRIEAQTRVRFASALELRLIVAEEPKTDQA